MKHLHVMSFEDAKDMACESAWASNHAYDVWQASVSEGEGRVWAGRPSYETLLNKRKNHDVFLNAQKIAGLVMGQPADGDPQMCHWSYDPSHISLAGLGFPERASAAEVGRELVDALPDPGWC